MRKFPHFWVPSYYVGNIKVKACKQGKAATIRLNKGPFEPSGDFYGEPNYYVGKFANEDRECIFFSCWAEPGYVFTYDDVTNKAKVQINGETKEIDVITDLEAYDNPLLALDRDYTAIIGKSGESSQMILRVPAESMEITFKNILLETSGSDN